MLLKCIRCRAGNLQACRVLGNRWLLCSCTLRNMSDGDHLGPWHKTIQTSSLRSRFAALLSSWFTYNNQSFVLGEELSQQCVGCCAVQRSTNTFNCPQYKTECYKHCSIWHGRDKPVKTEAHLLYIMLCNVLCGSTH